MESQRYDGISAHELCTNTEIVNWVDSTSEEVHRFKKKRRKCSKEDAPPSCHDGRAPGNARLDEIAQTTKSGVCEWSSERTKKRSRSTGNTNNCENGLDVVHESGISQYVANGSSDVPDVYVNPLKKRKQKRSHENVEIVRKVDDNCSSKVGVGGCDPHIPDHRDMDSSRLSMLSSEKKPRKKKNCRSEELPLSGTASEREPRKEKNCRSEELPLSGTASERERRKKGNCRSEELPLSGTASERKPRKEKNCRSEELPLPGTASERKPRKKKNCRSEELPLSGTASDREPRTIKRVRFQELPELVILSPKEDPQIEKREQFQASAEDVHEENVTNVAAKSNIEKYAFYLSEQRGWKSDIRRQDLLYGKYSKAEDAKLIKAVYDFIRMRGWTETEGLEMLLHPSEYGHKARGCWIDIAQCLPERPVKQINARAHILLGGRKRGPWSKEELEMLTDLQATHGHNWKKIGVLMGRPASLCKDRWRHYRLFTTKSRGPWTQDELDKLCKLVRRSLRVKESIPAKKYDRRALRDCINWEWICDEMQRESSACAQTWYERLASPLIRDKKWANSDDRLLLQSLMKLAPSSAEAVDWDTILDHRDGQICMQRWTQMTRLLGTTHDHAPFEDKLEVLAKRYAPDLLPGIEVELE